MLKSFKLNETGGKDYVVGDIHGCYNKLKNKLNSVGFDLTKDRLFSVGDLVDRGPENNEVLTWLGFPWFHAVMGNHDDMAVRWPLGNMSTEIYRRNGGGWNIDQCDTIQKQVADKLSQLPVAIEVETTKGVVGIVHADCPYDNWDKFAIALRGDFGSKATKYAKQMAMWSRGRMESQDCTGVRAIRAVIVGHTPVEKPVTLGNVIHIDTGAVFGREFTILDLESLTYF